MSDADDSRLVRAARRGDRAARATLYRRYAPLVWRVAYAIVGDAAGAEDVLQDSFLQAFAALERFDERRPLAPWLRRIAVNRALNVRRRSALPARDAADSGAHDRYAGVDGDEVLLAAIRGLSQEHREAIVMRYWLDLSPAQIAAACGVPEGTVRSRLARALGALRGHLGERHVERA